jgi:hypothetical protein
VNQETVFSQKEWNVEFVQDVPEDTPVPGDGADPDRAVTWKKLGSFTVGSHRDATWAYGDGPDIVRRATGDNYENGRVGSGKIFIVQPTPNDWSTSQMLRATRGRYQAVPANPIGTTCWHYRDGAGRYVLSLLPGRGWLFVTDGQPLAERFRRDAIGELSALFSPDTEKTTDGGRLLSEVQKPFPLPATGSYTEQGVTFDGRSGFAGYNWELFLHVPVLVGQHLSRQQRFPDAQEWLQLVFDPTSGEARTAQNPDPVTLLAVLAVPPGRPAGPHRGPGLVARRPRRPRRAQGRLQAPDRAVAGQPIPAARGRPATSGGISVGRRVRVPGQLAGLGRRPLPPGHQGVAGRGDHALRPSGEDTRPTAQSDSARLAPAPR